MPKRSSYRLVFLALVLLWLAATFVLMIADVWDETNGLVVFASGSRWEMTKIVLTRSVGFWRPIPILFGAHVVRALDREVAWRLLRVLNTALLLVALWRLLRTLDAWDGRDERRNLAFAAAFLFSAGALICATWHANLFDVWTLLLLAFGLELLRRDKPFPAGVLFGVGFFCKETTAIVFPLLVLLWAIDRISIRTAIRAAIPAAIFGAIYFALRAQRIPFASPADTHQFHATDFLPTLTGLAESFWRESLLGDGPTILGFAFFALSFAALRTWRARGAFALFVLACAVMYWQMTALYAHGAVIHYLVFHGRLYLIPVTLTLFVFALERRTWVTLVLLIPLVYGAITTGIAYAKMQRSYRRIYALKPPLVNYAMKPLHDPERGIEIGAYPNAPVRLDPMTGALTQTR